MCEVKKNEICFSKMARIVLWIIGGRRMTDEMWRVKITAICARHEHVFPLLSCMVCNGDEDDE